MCASQYGHVKVANVNTQGSYREGLQTTSPYCPGLDTSFSIVCHLLASRNAGAVSLADETHGFFFFPPAPCSDLSKSHVLIVVKACEPGNLPSSPAGRQELCGDVCVCVCVCAGGEGMSCGELKDTY